MQINWTLVAGLAAFSLAAAACWDAGTAARARPGPWRVLTGVYLALLAELLADTRFAAVQSIDAALPGTGRHAVQIGLAAAMLLAAGAALVAVTKVARRTPWFATAGTVALAAVLLFGVEMLSIRPAATLLYRLVGPTMLIGWLWLACGAAAVGVAVIVVRAADRSGRPG